MDEQKKKDADKAAAEAAFSGEVKKEDVEKADLKATGQVNDELVITARQKPDPELKTTASAAEVAESKAQVDAAAVSDTGECCGVGTPSDGNTPQDTQEVMRTIRPRVHVIVTRVNEADTEIDRPEYGSIDASGADLKAAKDTIIPRQSVQLVKTGIKIAIPPGYEAQVRSRSGLALKKQVFVLNAPGTVDSDYRGDVGVILFNAGTMPYEVKKGDRIAQLVIAPVKQGQFVPVTAETFVDARPSERGEGGFGSTGK